MVLCFQFWCNFGVINSLSHQCTSISYLIFNLCGFFIESSFSSQISNIRYFVFQSLPVVTKPVKLGILFSVSVIFVLQSVFFYSPLVLGIFLSTFSVLFSRSCLSASHHILVTNPLVLGILVSIALTLVTNLSYTAFWQRH